MTSDSSLWELATFYSLTNRQEQALECVRRLAEMAQNPEQESACYLAMGRLYEQLLDFPSAAQAYRRALSFSPKEPSTSYWALNNLGFSLVKLGDPTQAVPLLRSAILVDPSRPNAFKNLGLALQYQGEITSAAECFVLATKANPGDTRSLRHLEELIETHPGLLLEMAGLRGELDACRKAVGTTNRR